jgi:hypothetical protein
LNLKLRLNRPTFPPKPRPAQSCIGIHSLYGEHLESIGYNIQKQIQAEQTTQLQEQIVLLQSLYEKITQEVELPAQAIAGLGDLLLRVRGIVEK